MMDGWMDGGKDGRMDVYIFEFLVLYSTFIYYAIC